MPVQPQLCHRDERARWSVCRCNVTECTCRGEQARWSAEVGLVIGDLSASSECVSGDTDSGSFPDPLESPVSYLPSPCHEAVTDSLDDECMPNPDVTGSAASPNINRWHPSVNCGTWLAATERASHPIPVKVILCNIVWHLRQLKPARLKTTISIVFPWFVKGSCHGCILFASKTCVRRPGADPRHSPPSH